MEIKIFSDKKIIIRKIIKSDLKNIKKFQVFINSFLIEDAKLSINKKVTPNAQKEFLKKTFALEEFLLIFQLHFQPRFQLFS